jgi:pseudaminic acid biosynthesis-associated methylase
MKTEQERFWAGSFGDEYINRNVSDQLYKSNVHLFTKILGQIDIETILEIGANVGMNLKAIKQAEKDLCKIKEKAWDLPITSLLKIKTTGLEINKNACDRMQGADEIIHSSIFDYITDRTWDMTISKGVLIHINPKELHSVYSKLYHNSNKYILISEYYNPTPMSIEYRGHKHKLFKRDFVGEMLDMYKNLKIKDYGFVYHKDPIAPLDDNTWFLLEKS